jgi:hypothetical protein
LLPRRYSTTKDWRVLVKSSTTTDGGPTNELLEADVKWWCTRPDNAQQYQFAVAAAVEKILTTGVKVTKRVRLAVSVCACRDQASDAEIDARAQQLEGELAERSLADLGVCVGDPLDHPLFDASTRPPRESSEQVPLVFCTRAPPSGGHGVTESDLQSKIDELRELLQYC